MTSLAEDSRISPTLCSIVITVRDLSLSPACTARVSRGPVLHGPLRCCQGFFGSLPLGWDILVQKVEEACGRASDVQRPVTGQGVAGEAEARGLHWSKAIDGATVDVTGRHGYCRFLDPKGRFVGAQGRAIGGGPLTLERMGVGPAVTVIGRFEPLIYGAIGLVEISA